MQRTSYGAAPDLLVRLRGLLGRDVGHHGGVAAERAVQPLDPRERVGGDFGGGHLPRPNFRRDLGQHQLVQIRHPNLPSP